MGRPAGVAVAMRTSAVSVPSTLPEYQIDDPAAANVDLLRVAAMSQHIVAVAPGVLQRVRQDRHRREVPALVHPAGDGHGRGRAPLRREYNRPERVAHDVTQITCLKPPLLPPTITCAL